MKSCSRYLALLTVCYCLLFSARAQTSIWNASSFAFSRDTASLMNMAGATQVSFTGAYGNTPLVDFPSNFRFRFGLTDYSNFAISSYGYIKLGRAINYVNPTLQDSIISVLYCFTNTYTCSYQLFGTAPNRTFVIEWSGNYNFVGPVKYQLWLSERTGRIQMIYETGLKSYYYGNGYAIYCKTRIFNQPVIASLKSKPQKQLPTINYSAYETNNYDSIGAKTRYIFQPDTIKPVQPGQISFSNVLPGCVDVNVKDSSVNETVFRVERNDGAGYNFIAQFLSSSTNTTGTVYTYNNSRLQPDSDYLYRAFASNGFLNSDTVIQRLHTPMPLLVGLRKIPGDYPSLNALLQDAACKHIGPELVIELQSNYDFSAEGAPVYFYPFLQTKVLRHITVRPSAGSQLILSASFANPLVLVDSVRNVEIDGRAGGTGSTNNLTFRQLNNQWPVISYIRYADSGLLHYCNIEGSGGNGGNGLVYLGAYNPPYYTYLVEGVNGNTVSHCKIGPQSGFAQKGIVVESSERGENITLRDNEIYRFYGEAIDYRHGGRNSLVSNNRLYQPSPVQFIANYDGATAAMLFTEVDDNFRVDSNKIGGAAAQWGIGNWIQTTYSPPPGYYSFISMSVNQFTGTGYISNNQIANGFAQGDYPLHDINILHGSVVIEGNRIGSVDSANSIGSSTGHSGISVTSVGKKTIRNNTLSGLSANGGLFLIGGGGDTLIITRNDIGGSDNYNANHAGNFAEGIDLDAESTAIIKNNTIRGITSEGKGVWGLSEEWGFTTPSVKNMIFDSNSVHHLSGRMTVYGAYARVYATENSSFSNNQIYALRGVGPSNSPGANQPAVMVGLSVDEVTFPGALDTNTVRIRNNFIHSLEYVTPSTYAGYMMTGIGATGRRLEIYNNMVALGIGANGQPTDSSELEPVGINFSGAIRSAVEHNSIYIGGSGSDAVGMIVPISASTLKNVFLTNNIIQIDRHKPSVSQEYSYIGYYDRYGDSIKNIAASKNIWFSSFDTAVTTKLQNWRATCGCDSSSFVADPLFVRPNGDSSSQDLHLMNGSAADAAGTPSFANIPYDFDHDLRSSFSPVDIGADAIRPCDPGVASVQLSAQGDSLVTCGNSGLNISATAQGSSNLQWQWNLQDIAGATTTDYTVTKAGWYRLTAKTVCGWISSKNVYVSIDTTGPRVNILQPDTTICLGSSIQLTASGSTTYLWSGPGLSSTNISVTVQPSSSGTYTYQVTGTKNGCTSSDQVKISVVNNPAVSVSPNDTSICRGSQVNFIATGASTYLWRPATGLSSDTASRVTAQPSVTTMYTVQGKIGAGCATTVTRTITVMPPVAASVSISSTPCSSGTITFTANVVNGGNTPKYTWFLGTTPVGTDKTVTLSNISNGSIVSVQLTSDMVCANPKTVTASDTVSCVATAIPNVDGMETYRVFPNPASSSLLIQMKFVTAKKIAFQIDDINGRRVYSSPTVIATSNYSKTIDVSRLPQGCYHLSTLIGGQKIIQKIIIAR